MDVGLFDYDLPPELIAQEPAEPRDASRLLALERATGRIDDRRFSDLEGLLRPGDCLVANHTRVIPARVLGMGEGGRPVELLFLRPVDEERWEAMVRPGRRCRVGARIEVAGGAARARVVGEGREGTRVIAVEAPWPVPELLDGRVHRDAEGADLLARPHRQREARQHAADRGEGACARECVVHRERQDAALPVQVVQHPAVLLADVDLAGVGQHQQRQAPRDGPEQRAKLPGDRMAGHR